MEKAIIGKKIGMTQIFDEAGRVVPVTVIEAGPCTVVQKKTAEKDGYEAIQLGYETVPERKLTKPEVGHQKKAGLTEFKKVRAEGRRLCRGRPRGRHRHQQGPRLPGRC